MKCGFQVFLGAKITEIGIQNPKLIGINDYKQFQAHFEWFLSLFQISDIKHKFLQVKLKVRKNCIFWAKKPNFRKVSKVYFCPPIQVMRKIWVKMAFKLVLIWPGIGVTIHLPCQQDAYELFIYLKTLVRLCQ